MRRELLILTFGIVLLTVGVGGVNAQAGVQEVNLGVGESQTFVYDSSVQDVSTQGPIQRDSRSGNQVTVSAQNTDTTQEATLTVQTSNGQVETAIMVQAADSGGSGNYGNLEDQWVQQRINRVETADGTLVVYEQRDPTRGPIDNETGLPVGEWRRIDVNENGEPQWIYNDLQGALEYQAKQANTRYSERTTWIAGSVSLVLVSWVTQFLLLPKYRKRKEEDFLFS